MPGPKDSRRQIADPTNEPNFEAISCVHPVPPLNVPFQSPNVVVPKKEPFVPVTMALPPTANESLSFVAAATKSAPAERTGKASANAIVSNSQIFPKASMDRDAALAEIKILRAHLNADVLPLSSSPGSNVALEQGPNRSSLLGSGYIGQTPVQQLARMPNPFPTRSRGLSQLESILERNAIVVGIRKQHEQEALQQQQLQDIQVQQKLQEFLTQQQQLEDIQAQRKLQEIKAQETFQQLQTHQALGEFQKQQAIQELQRKTMAQHIQYQHNVQSNFNSYAALPVAQQPLMSPPPPQSTQAHFPQPTNFDNSATISELLRLGYRFPPNA